MDYQQTIAYLYDRLPMFTRDGAAAYKKDIGNISMLCEALGNPQTKFRSVHVAGTNGKGSSSHMLAAVLARSGYRTALYTSPHLIDFRERIRIGGQMIPEEEVIRFVHVHQALIEQVKPSFFEVTVALAFDYFAKQHVDIAIVETGLGGRLDSTNIIHPVLSLITNIGFDHKDLLGDTLAQIASEKAGIIKYDTPVVISEYQRDIAPVFEYKAQQERAELIFAAEYWHADILNNTGLNQEILVSSAESEVVQRFTMDLMGSYQSKNLLGILSAVGCLRRAGFVISEEHLHDGLSHVQSLTGLRGRWELISSDPLVICDTGHNEDGWREILQNIARTPYEKLHIVLGVMKDKDLNQMLPLLPKEAVYCFCHVGMSRALPAAELADIAYLYGLSGQAFGSIAEAYQAARNAANPNDLIFVGGSTFVVGEFLGSISDTGS